MIKAVIFDMYETLITHYRCPLYFSKEMAMDAGISEDTFQGFWRPTNSERSTGKITFETILQQILKACHCYSDEVFQKIRDKRIWTKREIFHHLHEEIPPLLQELKRRGIKIGLISNCFSEEAEVIKESILFPYFDGPCLSWDEGIEKPDLKIFERCLKKLEVNPEECLYVGDGGSFELEAAKKVGMKPIQAVWYFSDHPFLLTERNPEFSQADHPLELLKYLKEADE